MRSKPVKWLCLVKITVRIIKSLQIQSSAYFRLCWNSFQGILLVSRICYSVVSKDPTKETPMPKVLKPFLGQDEIRSVAPKALTYQMRDPWGVSLLWALILIPSCLLNKSIMFSSADFFNHSDRAVKADIMSCKHCQLRVQVCAQMSPTAVTMSKHRWENLFLSPSDSLGSIAGKLFLWGDQV